MSWFDNIPMPPCPECDAIVESYSVDRDFEGYTYLHGPAVFSPPRMFLKPCGHEVAGYEVVTKWTPLGDVSDG